MFFRRSGLILSFLTWMATAPAILPAAEPSVDLTGYRAESGTKVEHEDGLLRLSWTWRAAVPAPDHPESGELVLDLRPGHPLIRSIAAGRPDARPIVEDADPLTFLLVGRREAPGNRPPGMSVFNVFFDSPAKRPFETFKSKLELKRVGVASRGNRTIVTIGDLTIGSFAGRLAFTIHAGSPLIQMETVIRTGEDRRAILYDTGLAPSDPGKLRLAWMDGQDTLRRQDVEPQQTDRSLAVRHRLLIAEAHQGSIAILPPPHQFFFPRDLTDNLSTAWFGKGHRGLDDRFGFGIRQAETGGGHFVPWFNAPPGTDQRLGVFFLLSAGGADEALRESLRYTHGDRFPDLPGYRKFTTHWHMAITMAALKEKERGGPRSTPDFVGMFKAMGVDIVHLAEFHGDGHPQDAGPVRLAEMRAMFAECRRLSDETLLFLPGEEANAPLGLSDAGRRPGHWVYLFPRPVYWTMKRAPGQPFEEEVSPYGRIYHVGDGADWQRLLGREAGLAWTSHPRIKGSSWTPDLHRREDFYLSDRWLGAAWKAVPADLSHDRLGRRALDLLDDMSNWGQKKVMPGEVDVFKIDRTHELYGHMNVNYLRLDGDRLPRFDQGWQPVLDALRGGRFFVSTGEVLIPEFTVNGRPSGSDVTLGSDGKAEVAFDLTWTFPMQFAEVISGDGSRVFRERIDLSDTGSFGGRTLRVSPVMTGRKWVRVEAWDVAANGSFTQPVWLSSSGDQSPSPR